MCSTSRAQALLERLSTRHGKPSMTFQTIVLVAPPPEHQLSDHVHDPECTDQDTSPVLAPTSNRVRVNHPPKPAVVLTKLKKLDLCCTKVTHANPNPNPNPDPNPNPYPYQVTDAGCKALVAAIRSGALPALNGLELEW